MQIWLDAHISPLIAQWLAAEFSITCVAVREMNLRAADDAVIFQAAKNKGDVVFMTKDSDFRDLINRLKSPPKIILLTFGNCSNSEMKQILKKQLPVALAFLQENELVEIAR